MKRRVLSLVLALTLIVTVFSALNTSVFGANMLIYNHGPKEYNLTDKYLSESNNAKMTGEQLDLKAGGSATIAFYLPFNSDIIELTYSGTTAPVTVFDGVQSYVIQPAEGQTTVKYKLPVVERLGEKVYTFSADSAVKLKKISFKLVAEKSGYAAGEKEMAISAEEFMIQKATIMRTDSPMMLVNSGRRYIDIDDMSKTPIFIGESVYLPIHALARALSLYFEDLPDKKYVLLRDGSDELVFTEGFSYSLNKEGVKTPVENVVRYQNGKTYLPVRYIAEFYDRVVGYKDGMIAIDDNQYYVADYLDESTKVRQYIDSKFDEMMPSDIVGKTYYVAKSGNASDDNPGTIDAPFLTISKAGQVAQAGDTVIVKEGTYRETVTVKNDGTPTAPIVFKAAEGEKVIISAAEEVSDFITYGENLVVASIPSGDLGFGKNQVFYDGITIPEARYPNGPGIDIGDVAEPLSDNWPVAAPLTVDMTNPLHITNEELLDQPEGTWDGAKYITLRGMAYAISFAKVKHSKPGEIELGDHGTIYWDAKEGNTQIRWGYLCGDIDAIDLPGEWVVENGTLFMMPPEGTTVDDLTVEVKARQLCVDIPDNKCVQFRGFETIGGSMRLNNSELCVVKDCNIKYNNHYSWSMDQHSGFIDDANVKDSDGAPPRGEVGLYVGGYDNIFINNIFDEAAAAAIYGVGCYTYIENNLIKNCGYMGSYVAGLNFNGEAWKGSASPRGGMVVVGNTAFNSGRSPLQTTRPAYNGEWAMIPYEIAYNDFHNGMITSLDTGVIYTYMSDHGNQRRKTQMHNNMVYVNYEETWPYSFGIYHDGGTINIDTYNNLVFCTEPGVRFTTLPYTFTHLSPGTEGQCDVWENSAIIRAVQGGRDGLVPGDYPYGMMFDAGSTIDREPYTKNYDRIMSEDPTIGTWEDYYKVTADSEIGEGAENLGDRVRLDAVGEWVKIPAVDFGIGRNEVDVYVMGDKYVAPPSFEVIVGSSLEEGLKKQCKNVYFRSRDKDERDTVRTQILGTPGVNDVYIRMIGGETPIDICGIKVLAMQDSASSKSGKNMIYGGDYSESYCADESYSHEPKYGVGTDYSNPFINNTWGGSYLVYKDVEFSQDSDVATINYCTGPNYGGQKMQIRIDSIDAEPVGEFISGEPGWSQWTDVQIQLDKAIPEGKHDLYVTFFDDDPAAKGKTLNLWYIKFTNMDVITREGRTLHFENFTDVKPSPEGEFPPEEKSTTFESESVYFVNNTWPGTTFEYKDWSLNKDATKIKVKHCTSGSYSGQSVQIRIGSEKAEPIAEFKSLDTGWSAWMDIEVELKKPLKAGKYDVYVTFIEPDGKYASKSGNFDKIVFE